MSNTNWIQSLFTILAVVSGLMLVEQLALAVTAIAHRHVWGDALNQQLQQMYKALCFWAVIAVSITLWQYIGRETDLWFLVLLGSMIEAFGGYLFYKGWRKAIADEDSPAMVVALYAMFVVAVSLIGGYFVALSAVYTGEAVDNFLVAACAVCTGAITIIVGAATNWYVNDSLAPMLKSWREQEEKAREKATQEEEIRLKAEKERLDKVAVKAEAEALKLQQRQEADEAAERQRQIDQQAKEAKSARAEQLQQRRAQQLEKQRQPVLQVALLCLRNNARLNQTKRNNLEADLRILLEHYTEEELKQIDITAKKLQLAYEEVRFSPDVVMEEVDFDIAINRATDEVTGAHSNWPDGWVEQVLPQMKMIAEGLRSTLTPDLTTSMLQQRLVDEYHHITNEHRENRELNELMEEFKR